MQTKVYLTDLARITGGFPIDIVAIAELLAKADEVLPDGRNCREPLTKEQIKQLGFEIPE